MPPKVSVIIPVYNVERYLQQCLDSVVGQTLSPAELEILCVDDGSTDASPEILKRYAQAHSNLRAIRQENAGSSVARNRALDAATGDYVLFMDSDDWLNDPAALETLYARAASLKLDALCFCARIYCESDAEEGLFREDEFLFRGDYPSDLVLSGQQMYLLQLKYDDFSLHPWRRLYRRAFLTENRLRFVEGIVHQDQVFSRQTIALEEREACLDAAYYQYRVRADSITGNKRKSPYPTLYARLIGSRILQEFMQQRFEGADPEFVAAFARNLKGWVNLNVDQYLALSPEARRGFWRWVPAQRRGELRSWMRADIRAQRRRKRKNRLRRLIPERLYKQIKRLPH